MNDKNTITGRWSRSGHDGTHLAVLERTVRGISICGAAISMPTASLKSHPTQQRRPKPSGRPSNTNRREPPQRGQDRQIELMGLDRPSEMTTPRDHSNSGRATSRRSAVRATVRPPISIMRSGSPFFGESHKIAVNPRRSAPRGTARHANGLGARDRRGCGHRRWPRMGANLRRFRRPRSRGSECRIFRPATPAPRRARCRRAWSSRFR